MTASPTFVRVEMAFGYGVNSTGMISWTDVTEDVRCRAGQPAVTMRTGRSSVKDGITPGTLSFTLENESGDYDPLNSSGPYYGDLNVGVPVRILVRHDTVHYLYRWNGYVSSAWAQELTRYGPEVQVSAHDILGVMAAGVRDWPDQHGAEIEMFEDGNLLHWWRPGPSSWIDQVTGAEGRWTAIPEQVESPIAGNDDTWGIPWTEDEAGNPAHPVGWAELPPLWSEDPTGETMLSIVWRADGQNADVMHIFNQDAAAADYEIGLAVSDTYIYINLPNADGDQWRLIGSHGYNFSQNWNVLHEGVHHLLISIPDGTVRNTPYPMVWLDGKQLVVGTTASDTTNLVIEAGYLPIRTLDTTKPVRIGSDYPGSDPTTRMGGVVEHLAIWDQVTASESELGAMAVRMWESLSRRRVSMDERVSQILAVAGMSSHEGDLDESGIYTLQGFQPGSPIEQLQQVEDTEQGRIWVEGNYGTVYFSKRQWAWEDTVSTTVQLIATDDATVLAANPSNSAEPLWDQADIGYDPLAITNRAEVNSTHGRQQRASDAASIETYGIRNPITLSGLLHGTDLQSKNIAEWLVTTGSTPKWRIGRLGFKVEDNQSVLEEFAAKVQEGWLIEYQLTLSGSLVTGKAHVIGLEHVWTDIGWMVYLDLDGSRADRSLFLWGTSDWGGSDVWSF